MVSGGYHKSMFDMSDQRASPCTADQRTHPLEFDPRAAGAAARTAARAERGGIFPAVARVEAREERVRVELGEREVEDEVAAGEQVDRSERRGGAERRERAAYCAVG